MSDDTTTYKVEGMSCGGCVRSLEGALGRAAPELELSVVLEGGTVVVHGPHDPAVIQQAVEDAGFDFVGVAS
jgi:copper chaperone